MKMKSNKIGIYGNTDKNYSWFILTTSQGFERNGYQVEKLDFRNNSLETLWEWLKIHKFRYVFDHMSFRNPKVFEIFKKAKKSFGTKFVHCLNDAYLERYSGGLEGIFDVALVGKKVTKQLKNKWKIPIYFWPYTTLCYDRISNPVSDLAFEELVFTGSWAHPERKKFLKKLSQIMPLRVILKESDKDLRHRTPELSSSAPCILGACTGYDVPDYIDVRPFQYLGTGACMIIRKFMGMDKIIPTDLYYPFDSYDEPKRVKKLFEKIKKTDTLPMRKKAFEFMQTYHSCEKRIKDTVEVLEGRKDRIPVFLDEI